MTGPTTSRSSGEWSWRGRGKPRPVAPGLVDRYGDRAGDGDRGRSGEASWETSDWKAKKSSWPSARWESAVKHRHKESWPTLWGWWSRSSGGWYGRAATQGGLPVGLRASQVYTLPPFTAAEIAGFKVEAGRQIAAQAAADGGGVGPVNAVGAVGAPVVLPVAGQVAQAVLSAGAGGAATSAVTFEPDTLYWLAAETLEDISYGDPMSNALAAAADGAKAIHLLPSGRSLFVVCCRGRDPSLGKFKGCSGQECAVYGELEHVRAKDGEMVHRLFGE
eukprot:s164_g15.t1